MEGQPKRRFPSALTSHAEQERMVEEIRGTSFPSAMRGYDRDAVDAYVERVNRLIAELETSRSPESAAGYPGAHPEEEQPRAPRAPGDDTEAIDPREEMGRMEGKAGEATAARDEPVDETAELEEEPETPA